MTTWVHNSQCQPYEIDSRAVPMMRNLLNICPEIAMRNLCHHDRWGSANSFGDFLLVSNLDLWWSQWISESSAHEKHEILPRHIFAWYELHDKVAQLSPSCMLACILCALSFLGLHRCAFGHGCINKNGFVLQSLWWVLCWIFLLITQCGIFTTMIVEGLRKNLEMFWLSLECSVPEMAGKGFKFGKMLKTPRRAVFWNV